MKACPICKSMSFDDMEICFGCMHRFGEESLVASKLSNAEEVEVEEPKLGYPSGVHDASSSIFIDAGKMNAQGGNPANEAVVPVPGSGFNLVISVQPSSVLAGCPQ